jgi:hypothetical protein
LAESVPGTSKREKGARYVGYLLAAIAIFETITALIALFYYHAQPIAYNYAAVVYGLIAYALLTYADVKKKERLGLNVSLWEKRVVTGSIAFLWLWATAAFLALIDYSLSVSPITSSVEVSMLNDLIVFDGVIIGFASVLIGQDLRDLTTDRAKAEPKYRKYLMRNRRWGIYILTLLTVGTFASFLSLPWVNQSPNVGYLYLPIQATVFSLGMLVARIVWY